MLRLKEWAQANYLLDDGWWVCLQFDTAIGWAGTHIENKLNEYDPHTHKPRYTLEELLQENPVSLFESLIQTFGVRKGITAETNGSATG